MKNHEKKKLGPTEIRTRIVGFKVQSDSHYTIRPLEEISLILYFKNYIHIKIKNIYLLFIP